MTESPHIQPTGTGHAFRLPRRIFIGSLVSPQTLLSIKIIRLAILGVGTSGVIRFVEDLEEAIKKEANNKKSNHATLEAHEEDRSSTPVPIPNSTSNDSDHISPLSPVAILEEGNLTQQHDIEQRVVHKVVAKQGWNLDECEIVRLGPDSFLCPGFIDTHTHAPQVPNLGLGQQYELLDWLQFVTFPRERKFEDPIYAQKTYESVVERMINSGTTCAAIYATLHEEATMVLADICNQKGLRALVGKCQMDRNSPVDYIEKNPSASMEATRNFINYCRNLKPFGTPQSPEDEIASPLSGVSDSPEMSNSIARLKVTLDEMIDGDKKSTRKEETSTKEETESVTSTSSSNTNLESTSSKAKTSAPSNTINHVQKNHNPLQRHSSLSSSSTSSHNHRGGGGRGHNGTDTPKTKREKDHSHALVQPILTPRFAISCSDALLTSISAMMSRDPSLRLQTHLSENEGEIEFTKKLFPFTSCYTEVYDHFSLLTPRTILAHAVHLSDEEMKLITKRKCGISHCPTSNNNLRSGVSRVGEMLNRGIKVGLGTDMSGGFGLSILTAIREASVVAKVLGFSSHRSLNGSDGKTDNEVTDKISQGASLPIKEDQSEKHRTPAVGNHQARPIEISGSQLNKERIQVENYDFCNGPLSVATLFYLATLGGAEVCSLAHRVGSLESGKEFDALLVNTANGCPNLYIEEDDELEEKLEKVRFLLGFFFGSFLAYRKMFPLTLPCTDSFF